MKTQLSKSADQKIRTKGILCAQMREIKRKNTLDRKSNVEKTLILSRVFLFWIRGVRNQCFPTAPWKCPQYAGEISWHDENGGDERRVSGAADASYGKEVKG